MRGISPLNTHAKYVQLLAHDNVGLSVCAVGVVNVWRVYKAFYSEQKFSRAFSTPTIMDTDESTRGI